MEWWSLIYTGLPNLLLVDQGCTLGDQFVYFGKIAEKNVPNTGVESNNLLGVG